MKIVRKITAVFVVLIMIAVFPAFTSSGIESGDDPFKEKEDEQEIIFELQFDPESLKITTQGGVTYVTSPELSLPFEEGEAALPFRMDQVLVHPAAENIKIEFIRIKSVPLTLPQPIAGITHFDFHQDAERERADPANHFPQEHLSIQGEGWIRGLRVLDLRFDPIIRDISGRFQLATGIEARIYFDVKDGHGLKLTTPFKRDTSVFRNSLEHNLLNPNDLDRFPAKVLNSPMSILGDEDVQYIVITDTAYVKEAFDQYIEWKNRKGVPTKLVEMSFIKNNYNGTDNAEKIRNFLIDAFNTWDTEIVLLGGDTAVVPYRGAYVKAYSGSSGWVTKTSIASDLYYSDLDGDWNLDGDGYWGEVEDGIDMKPDLLVGRAPVQTENEADTFVKKTLTYEKDPPRGYLDNVTLAGEYLDSVTNSSRAMDLIKNNLLPSSMFPTSLYDSDYRKFGNLNRNNFMGQIDKGTAMVFHSGHSGWNTMSVGTASGGSLYNSHISSYQGGYKLGVLNTVGCIANQFNQNDAIVELHVKEPDGGTVAGIGNSHYGWYSYSSPGNGPSEKVQYRMVYELFKNGHTGMGAHFAEGKEYYTSYAGSYNSIRWVEMVLNLIGDPEISVRTAEPERFNISIPSSIGFDYPGLPVTVRTENGTPVKDALVCLEKSDFYSYKRTDDSGRAFFNYSSSELDKLNVTVTAYNFIPSEFNLTIDIIAPTIIINSNLNATTGDNFRLNCSAHDAAGLESVKLQMKESNLTINLTELDQFWITDLEIPTNKTDYIPFRVLAMDRSGNINSTDWMNITVTDDDIPLLVSDRTERIATTGDTMVFEALFSDNIGMGEVMVEYKGMDLENVTADMIKNGEIWSFAYQVPNNRTGERSYRYIFSDTRGNEVSGPVQTFTIFDDEAPVFISYMSEKRVNTSSTYRLETSVTDNIGVVDVTAEWWVEGWSVHLNDSMTAADKGWYIDLEAPVDELETRHYIFHARDEEGNWNSTDQGTVEIIDSIVPKMIEDRTRNAIDAGDDILFSVSFHDNIGVRNVTVIYHIGGGQPESLELDYTGRHWEGGIITSPGSLEEITYNFLCHDLRGNHNLTAAKTITVADAIPPEILNVGIPSSVLAGNTLNVTMDCWDNIGITNASASWWFGGEEAQRRILEPDGGRCNLTMDIPLDSFGTLYVSFKVEDGAGNIVDSERYSVMVIEFIPEPPEEPEERVPKSGEDLDRDGMDDLWEYEFGLDLESNDSTADPDGDGYSNLIEFLESTSPVDPENHPIEPDPEDEKELLLLIAGSIIVILIALGVLVAVVVNRKHHHPPAPAPPPAAIMISDDRGKPVANGKENSSGKIHK